MKKLSLLVVPLVMLLFVGVVYATITSNVLQGGGEVNPAPAKLEILYKTISCGVIENEVWNIDGVVGGEKLFAEIEVRNSGFSDLANVVLSLDTSWGVVKTYQVGALALGESKFISVEFEVPQEGGAISFGLRATESSTPPPPSPFLP